MTAKLKTEDFDRAREHISQLLSVKEENFLAMQAGAVGAMRGAIRDAHLTRTAEEKCPLAIDAIRAALAEWGHFRPDEPIHRQMLERAANAVLDSWETIAGLE